MLHKLKFNNQIVFIIAFVAVIVAFLINKGFISRFLNKNWCVNVAKYTYSFYMKSSGGGGKIRLTFVEPYFCAV